MAKTTNGKSPWWLFACIGMLLIAVAIIGLGVMASHRTSLPILSQHSVPVSSDCPARDERLLSVIVDENTAIDSNWHRNQLDGEQQQAYDALVAGYNDFSELIVIPPMTNERVKAVWSAVISDHPEFFWLSKHFTGHTSDGLIYDVVPSYRYDSVDDIIAAKEKMQSIADEVATSVAECDSDYDKAHAILCWIADNTEYDEEDCDDKQFADSSILDGNTVCSGYARAFQYLCNQAGIPCISMTGYAHEKEWNDEEPILHMWCVMQLDGENYYCDPTWCDRWSTGDSVRDEWFANSLASFMSHHSVDVGTVLPVANDIQYDSF